MVNITKSSFRVLNTLIKQITIFLIVYISSVLSQTQDTIGLTSENENIPQATNTELTKSIKDDSNELIFTPGDALLIKIYPDTGSFPNGIYPIDDQGYAFLPILGYKKITDKTVSNLESMLKDEYVNYLPQPNIQVQPLIRVSLLGGFHRPGVYWVDPRENMWTLLQRVGGTVREDGIEKLRWRRNRTTVTRDLVPYVESGESLRHIGFISGDQIRVTQRPKQRFWDTFRTDVLPILSITLSAAATITTAYIAYETYRGRR